MNNEYKERKENNSEINVYTNLWFINAITIQPILMMQTGIQPILTYTMNANEIQPILTYTTNRKQILCMCHDLEMCDVAVGLTWVPCLYMKMW